MNVNFKIGPMYLTVQTPVDFPWTDEVRIFRIDSLPEGAVPFVYSLEFTDEFNPVWGKVLYSGSQMLVMDVDGHETRIHYLPATGEPFALSRRSDTHHVHVLVDRRAQQALKWDRNLLGFLSLELDCLHHRAFLLHSSCIIHEGQAIVFTAPSGSGKSTQADLWAEHEHALIVNGDRSLLFFENGQWFVSGFPVCGSSSYCLNRIAPLKAIVFLEKNPDNQITVLSPMHSVRFLYSQAFVNRWNLDHCTKVSDMLIEISQQLPVLHYKCTKEPNAVGYLKKAIIPNCTESRSKYENE